MDMEVHAYMESEKNGSLVQNHTQTQKVRKLWQQENTFLGYFNVEYVTKTKIEQLFESGFRQSKSENFDKSHGEHGIGVTDKRRIAKRLTRLRLARLERVSERQTFAATEIHTIRNILCPINSAVPLFMKILKKWR